MYAGAFSSLDPQKQQPKLLLAYPQLLNFIRVASSTPVLPKQYASLLVRDNNNKNKNKHPFYRVCYQNFRAISRSALDLVRVGLQGDGKKTKPPEILSQEYHRTPATRMTVTSLTIMSHHCSNQGHPTMHTTRQNRFLICLFVY